MGKVMSMIGRKMNRFNVESRAHRVLDRDKPVPAPKFESNIQDMQRALELDPDLVSKLNKKDSPLDDRLKSVYVTSQDSYIDYGLQRKQADDRALPYNRRMVEDFDYGFKEPDRLMPGRCTLRQAIQFINDHHLEPDLWTQEKIANDYKIKKEAIEKILLYFKSFQVYIPDIGRKENILTQAKAKMIADKRTEQM